ncbi:MAG TPA: hypothetical protein VH763_08690 [Gemmatimonadales bacterium]|jgi:hypothetical protein
MAWKEAAADLGTGRLVSGLKALQGKMKKRDFKRLVSTTVAQLLEVHPGLGRRKARRRARKATGTRPGKLGLGKKAGQVLKETAEVALTAAVAAGARKAADKIATRRQPRRRAKTPSAPPNPNGKPEGEPTQAGA